MNYYFERDRVVREDGYVAVAHRNSNGTNVRVGEVYYVFVPQNNVSMAWVAPAHVDKVLGELARVCCGQHGKKFFPASLVNVNIWTYNKREGNE